MMSWPTVLATAVVTNAPTRFATAATVTACLGVIARVETAVAIEFAVSWKPFVKSKKSAVTMTAISRASTMPYRFLTRIASRTSAAFSQASMASSSRSWMSFQRMIGDRIRLGVEELGHTIADEPVAFVLELLELLELQRRVLEAVEPAHGLVELDRRAQDDLGLLTRMAGNLLDAVRVEVVGGVVDEVADVVERHGQPVDVVAVEGRHERPVEQADDLACDVVSLVLVRLDPADELCAVVREAVEQLEQQPRDVDGVARGRREEVEELAALGDEADPHCAGAVYQTTARAGNEHVTVRPPPAVREASTVPPAAATTCLTMARPRPVPRVERPRSPR